MTPETNTKKRKGLNIYTNTETGTNELEYFILYTMNRYRKFIGSLLTL